MAFRFDNILEDWAVRYKKIAHDPAAGSKERAFYRIKSLTTENDWMRNSNTAKSPCMLYSMMVDAQSGGAKTIKYQYDIYIALKAVSSGLKKSAKQDDMLTADIQLELDEMVQDLLAFLGVMRKTGVHPITEKPIDANTRRMLAGLELEKAEWASIPVKLNEWHISGISIDNVVPKKQCVDKEMYDKSPRQYYG